MVERFLVFFDSHPALRWFLRGCGRAAAILGSLLLHVVGGVLAALLVGSTVLLATMAVLGAETVADADVLVRVSAMMALIGLICGLGIFAACRAAFSENREAPATPVSIADAAAQAVVAHRLGHRIVSVEPTGIRSQWPSGPKKARRRLIEVIAVELASPSMGLRSPQALVDPHRAARVRSVSRHLDEVLVVDAAQRASGVRVPLADRAALLAQAASMARAHLDEVPDSAAESIASELRRFGPMRGERAVALIEAAQQAEQTEQDEPSEELAGAAARAEGALA